MDNTEYKLLHSIILDIYAVFKNICEKNNLRFYAISGTTIGVHFWKGFIPWDDDMDIAMPVQDYEKFLSICKKDLPKHLKITEYIWFGAKIHNINTTFIDSNFSTPNLYTGAFIDIVPLVALPDSNDKRKQFMDDAMHFREAGFLFEKYNNSDYSLKQIQAWAKKLKPHLILAAHHM